VSEKPDVGGDLGGDIAAMDYEQARDELADVVHALETGGLSLDESVALWERGELLARRCEQQLAGARERVDDVLRHAEHPDAEAGAETKAEAEHADAESNGSASPSPAAGTDRPGDQPGAAT
jgi:exodeoxyribonuclease VII small subunit